MKKIIALLLGCIFAVSCQTKEKQVVAKQTPFVWQNANLYFLLTDRFNNGDPSNDINFERIKTPAKLRGFEGGDLKGITQKIKEGYFSDLGINAIWMTPIVEQIHDATDEGTGVSYGFHGYWARDWTAIDPNFGTKEDLHELVEVAHKKGIRILLDAVINHTGPVTEKDPVWPEDWVRTSPKCTYDNFKNTVDCTLVDNLPDIRTDSNQNVELPPQLVAKWKTEGRYEEELKELDAFFARTGYPRAPRFYIIKWLTDYITEFGIDGYRADTVKHTEDYVWSEFKKECDYAFAQYKQQNPSKVMDDSDFYLVGEVYNYGISSGKNFNFGDTIVNYYDDKFTSQINFEFKWNAAQMSLSEMHQKYDSILHHELKGYSVLNYLSSHDDGSPFDAKREKTIQAGTALLLSPGASQMYYGDEIARSLVVEGTEGDATLRSTMDWNGLEENEQANITLAHYKKLGTYRRNHLAVGAGKHHLISESPYIFARTYSNDTSQDTIIVGVNFTSVKKTIDVSSFFEEGAWVKDAYSGKETQVTEGRVVLTTQHNLVLLERK